MEYAVIKIGGKQYRVSKGDIVEVDKQKPKTDGTAQLDQVLLLVSGSKVKIGKPKIDNVKVKAKILGEKKGRKIRVAKFKSKVRYRKVIGFRPVFTRLQIMEIESKTRSSDSHG